MNKYYKGQTVWVIYDQKVLEASIQYYDDFYELYEVDIDLTENPYFAENYIFATKEQAHDANVIRCIKLLNDAVKAQEQHCPDLERSCLIVGNPGQLPTSIYKSRKNGKIYSSICIPTSPYSKYVNKIDAINAVLKELEDSESTYSRTM